MSTSEQKYGTKVYPTLFLVAAQPAFDIEVRDPSGQIRFPFFEITDDEGNVTGYHTIRSYIDSFGNREIMTTADGEFGYVGMEMSDLRNELKGTKLLAQAWGYTLGGEDFANPDPKAFWILTLEELNRWLAATPHNQTIEKGDEK